MKLPFRLGAASQPRPALMFAKPEPVSWRENAPNRGLIIGVLAMTALMSATAVGALFVLPNMGQSAANSAEETQQVAASAEGAIPARDKITTIVAEPTGRKSRVATTSSSILVSDAAAAEATDMPLAADPRWAQVVAAGANKPLEAITAIPGAEKVIVKDPGSVATLSLVAEEDKTDPEETAAVDAIEAEVKSTDQGAQQITIKRSVNLRAKPQKGGQVMGVIPARTSVELVACTQWCEVIYKGQRGYVYKTYVQ